MSPWSVITSNTFICIKYIIKSNHFYSHITTAHMPWWVKFLRACSRQYRNNLHIDRTYLQTYTEDNVQNTHTYTQYTQCTIRHTYSYQYTFYIMYTYIHTQWYAKVQQIIYVMSWMCIVWYPVVADRLCLCSVCVCVCVCVCV